MTTTELAVVIGLAVTVIGCILGFKERAVIFRNYDDLGLVFLAVVPLAIGFLTLSKWILIPSIVTSVVLIIWLTLRSWQDNRSLWKLLVVLPTKLVLSILFIAFVFDLIAPSGKTQLARAKQRGTAAAVLAVIMPLIYRLVKNKSGFLHPGEVVPNIRRRANRES